MAVIKTGLATLGSQAQPIGTWSVTAKHDLGTILHQPADSVGGGPKTFMYVQYATGSGAAAYQGSPVAWDKSTITDAVANRVVGVDVSQAPSTTPCGFIWNTSTTAVTTAYYGWIQLAVPNEVMKSVICSTGASATNLVVWEVDTNLDVATAYTSIVEVIDTPFGMLCTGTVATPSESAISNMQRWDVLVLLNPYVT